jgi:hypothetical protein
METSRQLADRVIEKRRKAWERADPTTAIVATEQVMPEDDRAIQRVVGDAGFSGNEFDEMVRSVKSLIVRRVEALADHIPAENGD